MKDYEGYSIGKLFKLLNDPEVISLAGGLPSPDLFLKDETRRASQRYLEDRIEQIMQYTPVSGETALIDAIIQYLKRDRIQVSQENVLITSSGQQGLDILGRLLLDPGDVVMIDRPTFAGAIVAFQMEAPTFVGVDIEEDGSNIAQFIKKVETLRADNRRPKFIYVVTDFQNPSGITMSLEKREALLDLSYRYDIPIVEDSPYRHLRYYGESVPSLFSLDQRRGGEHVIGIYTFSKLFCPGMRIGFNVGPKEVIAKMANIKEGNTLNSPKYNQDMCTAFLTEMDVDGYIERCRAFYREKIEVFLGHMEELFPEDSGVTWTRPEGGLFLWMTLPERIDTRELFYEAIRCKVAFVPSEAFYGEHPETNHMRINFSYPSKDRLAEATQRLARCIFNRL